MLIPMFIQDHAGGVPAGDSADDSPPLGRGAAEKDVWMPGLAPPLAGRLHRFDKTKYYNTNSHHDDPYRGSQKVGVRNANSNVHPGSCGRRSRRLLRYLMKLR